ncbi:MAG: DUF3029 family protein [Clostridia bacterium]|nr:DUF3029 family protein [Clostridia bacterium]
MSLCDYSIYNYVTNQHYDYLNNLSPVKRASEIFRLETENLSFELTDDDEIFGWFKFNNTNNYENKQFSDSILNEDVKKIIDAPRLYGSSTNVDKGHTLVDYEYILNNGLSAYQEKIENELKNSPDNEYLSAMNDVLKSTKLFVEKMIFVAEKNENLKNASIIKNALLQVPFYPARNFREAIQSIWIIHFLLPLAENAWYSISLGKFDQYVYPYYIKSMSNGMTKKEAQQILYNFYQLLNNYADGACLLNVGAEYNELSELIIECQKEFSMPGPILGAKISENISENIWNMLIDEKLFSMGQPTFYGVNSCINALEEKGISHDIAKEFSNNSCMGISLAGEEFNSMWGCVFSVSAVLEATVNCGKIVHKDFTVPGISNIKNIDELYAFFEKSTKYLFDICVKSYEAKASFSEKTDPDPFVSILTKGCIEKHCDRVFGAKYHNVTVECMGMINVSDGICAIDKLVFQEKKYTLSELCEAIKNNFNGYENIREDILKCPKFGQNSEADLYAVKIAEILQKVIRSKNHDNIVFCPSLHTLDANVSYGNCWGAGFDGRLSGTPFAKNAGASNSVRKKEPTSLILSASKLPQHTFYGGQPLDINFSTSMVKNNKKEIAELIKVYLFNGGLQMQVNSLNSKMLKDAVKNPQNHENLIVRIGGYSNYFNRFSEKTKQEFIERVEYEES